MKKFLLALLVALCGTVSLFADDVADVKAVIIKDFELVAKGDFAGAFALCAPDYQETDSDGLTVNYEQAKWVMLSLDGKHPEEFLLIAVTYENKGAALSAEMIPKLRAAAHDPEFIKKYEALTPQIVSQVKADAALHLKTLEFVSVKVDGDQAVSIVEYDSKSGESEAVKRTIETVNLRKTDGAWLKYRGLSKNK